MNPTIQYKTIPKTSTSLANATDKALNKAPEKSNDKNTKLIPTTRPCLLANSKYGGSNPTANKIEARIPKINDGHMIFFAVNLFNGIINPTSKAIEIIKNKPTYNIVFFFDCDTGG